LYRHFTVAAWSASASGIAVRQEYENSPQRRMTEPSSLIFVIVSVVVSVVAARTHRVSRYVIRRSSAPAYAGLAADYSQFGLVFYGAPPLEVRPKVLAARKALELDPSSLQRVCCSQTRRRKTGSGRKPRRNTSKPLR
jgi:hypothetical protein